MLSKNQVKYIGSLKINKFRKKNRQFVAEGTKVVLDLVNSTYHIHTIYATRNWLIRNDSFISNKGIDVVEIQDNELTKISNLSSSDGVVAIVDIPQVNLSLESIQDELVLMLEDIRDPGNLGTIIRTADWFGIKQILCSKECVDAYNPKVVQATMGSISRVVVHYVDLFSVLEQVSSSISVFGTALDGEPLNSIELRDKGIIVIGNESSGISDKMYTYIDKKILIPLYAVQDENVNTAESLNASIATAIVCYEFRRRMNNKI